MCSSRCACFDVSIGSISIPFWHRSSGICRHRSSTHSWEQIWRSTCCAKSDRLEVFSFCVFVCKWLEANVLLQIPTIIKKYYLKKTYAKSNIGSSPSPIIPMSLVPRIWLKSIGPPMLFGVLPGWTGVFKPLRLPPLYVDAAVLCKHVASPTTRIPFSTASTGAAGILLCAAASKWRSQLSLILHAGPGAVIGLGEVPTEYRPGCGISIVLKSLYEINCSLIILYMLCVY